MNAADSAIDPRPKAHRRPGLDLLRALAIVLVVLYHAGLFGFELPGRVQRFGWIGVDLFFVLSGYLIAGQLFGAVARGRRIDLSRFYWRRGLRILPAYLALVAVYFLLPPAFREYPRIPPLWRFLTFTQNLGLRGGTSFSHAWSLCIEFQFYLALPLLVVGLRRTRWFPILLAAVLLWCALIRGWLAQVNLNTTAPSFGWWQQWIYYPTYSRLDALTIGVGLAALESFCAKWWSRLLATARWIWLPGITAIVVAQYLAEDGLSVISSSIGFSLVAFGMGTLLVCAVSPDLPLTRVAVPGAAFVATIAYSVYLSHKLAIHAIELFSASHPLAGVSAYLLMLMSILLIGCALFFAVERPFLKIRETRQKALA